MRIFPQVVVVAAVAVAAISLWKILLRLTFGQVDGMVAGSGAAVAASSSSY